MKKSLKVRVDLDRDKDKTFFSLTILEQTHKCANFGHPTLTKGGDFGSVFIHKGVALASAGSPAFNSYVYSGWYDSIRELCDCDCMVFFEGRLRSASTISGVPVKYWPRIKEAIEAYNEYFKE